MVASGTAPGSGSRRRRAWTWLALSLAVLAVAGGGIIWGPHLDVAAPPTRWDGPLTLPETGTTSAWPQFGRDAGHAGFLAGFGALRGQVAWTRPTGGPIISSPVGGGGLVYVASSDAYLYALQTVDGGIRWRYAIGPKLVNATPVLAGGLLLVAGDYTFLNAVDVQTGLRIWRYDSGDSVLAPPAADPVGGLALLAGGGSLFALDLRDGSRRWELQLTDNTPPGWPSVGAPAAAAGNVYWAPGVGNRLFALAETNGTTLWSFDAGDRLASTPVIGAGTVYLATWRGGVFALDATTGTVRWHRTLGGGRPGEGSESTPALDGPRLFVGSYQGLLYALDTRTGIDIWQFRTGGPILAAPTVGGSLVYCASEDGHLYALDRATGALSWTLLLTELRSSPALLDNRLIVGTMAGTVVGVR
ncbi:MAG: PQQ-binding-like beta-propeller repeat protein [Chloroflexia bacterium]